MFMVSRRGQRKTCVPWQQGLGFSACPVPFLPLCTTTPGPTLRVEPKGDKSPLLSPQEAHSAGEYIQHIHQALDIFYKEVGRAAGFWVPFPASHPAPPSLGASRQAVFSEIRAERSATASRPLEGRQERGADTKLPCKGKSKGTSLYGLLAKSLPLKPTGLGYSQARGLTNNATWDK